MKRTVTYICLAVALPVIISGIIWTFAKDAFRAGKQIGDALLEYLES